MKLIIPTLFLALTGALAPAAQAAPVEGRWRTQKGDGVVEVKVADDGTLVGVGAPGGDDPDRLDTNNPDPKLKGRKLLGAEILWGFEPDNEAQTKWSGGKIYDPDNGKTYACKLELKDGKLRIRGYVGISLFGRTEVWTREPPPAE
jgi:uncharacterized protein (DUF2147 family)